MSSSAKRLADRYSIQLSQTWIDWFDCKSVEVRSPGMMRHGLAAENLCQSTPREIWPGFMLPDTLPLVSNDYGDWICVRVTEEDEFGELLYWYHGGGDWIPLGRSLVAALIHDAVDQFRPIRKQMLRGASESRTDTQGGVLLRLNDPAFRSWASSELGNAGVDELNATLELGDYPKTLKVMKTQGWAEDAVACDLVEVYLQRSVQMFANQEVAKAAAIPWFPDYVHLMFDLDDASSATRERILSAYHGLFPTEEVEWPLQRWNEASAVAVEVLKRRQDLGWATTIAGWFFEKQNDPDAAIEVYAKGLTASSFSDQSVRFNSHAFAEDLGKFSAGRLAELRQNWPSSLRDDDYLSLYFGERKRSLLVEVSDYWRAQGIQAERDGRFCDAFEAFYAAGWDTGVSRLSEYEEILSALVRCAIAAGWTARAKVAQMHLDCLLRKG